MNEQSEGPPADVTIVDCGFGNVRSVQRMFEVAGGQAEIVTHPDLLGTCRRLVLPGVGAFDAGMSSLETGGWIPVLNQLAKDQRVPVLGICLGMQLLCRGSEEGKLPGLGWIAADVVQIDRGEATHLKLPHMGWADTTAARFNPLMPLDGQERRFYYVHKFRARCDREENVLCTATYGTEFTSGIVDGNIMGVQFHPEKSHRFGMGLMRKFLDLPC